MFTFLCEYQPDVHHLEISCGRKALRDTDEEGGEDEESCEVDSDNSLEEELLEVVCCVNNAENKESRKIDGHDSIVDPSLEENHQVDSFWFIFLDKTR